MLARAEGDEDRPIVGDWRRVVALEPERDVARGRGEGSTELGAEAAVFELGEVAAEDEQVDLGT